jgi:hypothetical protein
MFGRSFGSCPKSHWYSGGSPTREWSRRGLLDHEAARGISNVIPSPDGVMSMEGSLNG